MEVIPAADSKLSLQVGAVPGYITGHVEEPGAMQNTYNNYSGTRTQTQAVYGPAAITRSPMTMPAATTYMAKSASLAPGGPAMVSLCIEHLPAIMPALTSAQNNNPDVALTCSNGDCIVVMLCALLDLTLSLHVSTCMLHGCHV